MDFCSAGAEELLEGLREAEGVTVGLMQMDESLSPATYCVLVDAHSRASEALRLAKIFMERM